MGFWSGVWNGIKSIGSAISNVLKNSELMNKLLPILSVVIPPPFDVIALVAIMAISASMGVEENPDELGWQMNEADKKPEDFDSFKEYKEYLDREYPFDKEKFDALSEEQKMACRYIGMVGTMTELKESKGFEITPESLGVIVKGAKSLGWDEAQIGAFAKGVSISLANSGTASLADVVALAKGILDPGKQEAVSGAISAGAKEAGVTQDKAAIIDSMREASLQENV